MKFNELDSLELSGKTVLLREDLNVPLSEGKITSSARLKAALPTIEAILAEEAGLLIMSHLGRPEEGVYDETLSLKPVADWLSEALGRPVPLVKEWIDGVTVEKGEIKLLENCRFLPGEKTSDEELSQKMAALCDVFVMDAFATAHRKAASTYGVGLYAKEVAAGLLLSAELKALNRALEKPDKPVLAIVGGAKVSTKLTVLHNLLDKVDILIPGGGIANTLLLAKGYDVGQSLAEADLIGEAKELFEKAEALGKQILLPIDVIVATEFAKHAQATWRDKIEKVEANEMILDIGPMTDRLYLKAIERAKTILWNGPVGVFEFPQFSEGTAMLGEYIARSNAFSIAGGGDTVAAIEAFALEEEISYISTAGGAFLEFLEGKTLPSVAMLEQRAQK